MQARRAYLAALLAAVASMWASSAWAQRGAQLVPRPVLKLIVEHPALTAHLPREAPLTVSDHLLADGVTPSMFGKPLRILSDREIGAQPHLRFQSFSVDGIRARAVVEHSAERLEGVFVLESTAAGWWKVVEAKVARH